MMCIVLKPHEIEDVLHNRFDARLRRLRITASKPTDTVLLLIQWFVEYFNRYPELHIFSPRISPVVEAIDERVNFDLSPFFVRDHLFLLLMQTLMAYNTQRTWGKESLLQQMRADGPAVSRGGADDQPPTVQGAAFQQMVRMHAFTEVVEEDVAGAASSGGDDDASAAQRRDILEQLFLGLFSQKEWAAEDWGVDRELAHVIKMILSLQLCNSEEIELARQALVQLGIGLEEDFQADSDDEIHAEGEEEVTIKAQKPVKLGMHRGFIGADDDLYTPAFQKMKPEQDFDGLLPESQRVPLDPKNLRQEDMMQDFLYELVELPDAELTQQLRLDVNLWRRQQLVHKPGCVELEGSAERVWNVRRDLRKQLAELGIQLRNEDHLLQEFQCELHMRHEMRVTDFAAHLMKQEAVHEQNQVFFEIEINGTKVIYLDNLTGEVARRKVSLQLFGAHKITMRSRCLMDSKDAKLTIANPRLWVLISPKAFDPEVVSRVVHVGGVLSQPRNKRHPPQKRRESVHRALVRR